MDATIKQLEQENKQLMREIAQKMVALEDDIKEDRLAWLRKYPLKKSLKNKKSS